MTPEPSSATTGGPTSASTETTASSPSPTSSVARTCGSSVAAAMSRDEQAGQLLMVGLDANAGQASLDELIERYHLGGVILLGGWSGRAKVTAATGHLNALTANDSPRLLVAADQEGGQVQQLRGEGFATIPSARQQDGMTPDQLQAAAKGWASQLADAGINVNLAPVADTVPASLGRGNGPIGRWDRQFSADPAENARMVGGFIAGMHAGGVAATIKHFPGIGRISSNTDFSGAGITDGVTSADDSYLTPFAVGIRAKTDLVMVSTAIYSKLDPGVNAIFSTAIVTHLLRGGLGWSGVTITDDVGAAKAVASVPVGDRATGFIGAGGDIVLTAQPGDIPTMHAAIVAAAATDPTFAAKVTAATARVIDLKVGRGLARCS
ncbi:MAG: glycoside hydrolase family 3 N-terminal domain-containing protein [Nostocoides sp.]